MSSENDPSLAKGVTKRLQYDTAKSLNEATESPSEAIEPPTGAIASPNEEPKDEPEEKPEASISKAAKVGQPKSTSVRKTSRGHTSSARRTNEVMPKVIPAVGYPIPSSAGSESDSESPDDFSSSFTDPEADVKTASQLNRTGLFEAYARKLGHKPRPNLTKSLRTRGNRGPRLITSFVDYVHSLETRINSLEEQQDKGKDDNSQPGISEDEPTASSSVLSIKFFHFDEEVDATGRFKQDRDDMPDTYRSSVTRRHFIRAVYRWKNEKIKGTTRAASDGEIPDPRDIEVVGIRIYSRHVYELFERTTQYYNAACPMIELFKPFRGIIRNIAEFRAHLSKLESQSRSATLKSDSRSENPESAEYVNATEDDRAPSSSNTTDADQPRWPSNVERSLFADYGSSEKLKEAFIHFRELMSFIEKYLESQIKLYEELREGSASRIAFENLWMLFNLNDTIYCQAKKGNQELVVYNRPGKSPGHITIYSKPVFTPQAYRVVDSSGGGGVYIDPYLNAITPQSKGQGLSTISARERFSQLIIFCFSISFDGENYTPVEDFFIFKPFEGEVDITSLEGYPLRFHRQQEKTSNMLLERGRKFIDMTAISHMTYEGLTVGDDRQEVASSVIIDIKLFYQENDSDRPLVGPIKASTPIVSNQVIEVASWYSCNHPPPCQKLSCILEAFVEVSNVGKVNASLKRYLLEYEPEESNPKLARDAIKKHMEAWEFIFLLPGQVSGFALRSRKWVQLDTNLLRWTLDHDRDGRQSADDAGWKDLVLPPGYKDMVLAMVKNHTASTSVLGKEGVRQTSEVDLVKGKGKGCIILIHGAPGVGKTSTAECVAAYTKRPLFPITCGDIGYQLDIVEKNLDRLFYLAHRWGCVLLLDEADVFLAKRSKEDIKRNGLVSIFLRTLEYYSGVLFLTTNRVGAIDNAFRSRLHLTLYYPNLDRAQSRKIWKVNLRRLKELNAERGSQGRAKVRIDKEKILKYADLNFEELHWNGRQIRNAFQSALALADFRAQEKGRAPTLSVEQFETIAAASHEFDYYLQVTHGFDEDKMAARDRTRGAYKHSEARKLKSLPLSDEDSDDDESDSDASEVLPSRNSDVSDSDHGEKSQKKDKKGKKKSTKTTRSKKHEKDESKSERKKGKEKAKDTDESDDSSECDDHK
ncbi:hypothetical protein GGR53DRAFT_525556 [Hypoxylon sp. FL1150]|nr:hypothetical protein GGR53DRAFT_525556 [Hypoxylon sp. FL1150]